MDYGTYFGNLSPFNIFPGNKKEEQPIEPIGADGLVFGFTEEDPNTPSSCLFAGGDLGFRGTGGGYGVEFDTWDNRDKS